jgi:hypothetical protein
VRSDPERVYRRALAFFSADEIAEAFAATRGVASPTQLRAALKEDGRDLLTRFRALAPQRRPVVIQRWSLRRVAMAAAVFLLLLVSIFQAKDLLSPVQELPVAKSPECGTGSSVILLAQSVPSAGSIPCIETLPSGWKFGMAAVHNGRGRFWLDSDQAGGRAVTVTLSAECDLTGAREVSREEGRIRFEEPPEEGSRFSALRFDRVPGGCVTYDFDFDSGASPALAAEAEQALSFTPRQLLIDHVRDERGLVLCGLGVRCEP